MPSTFDNLRSSFQMELQVEEDVEGDNVGVFVKKFISGREDIE